MRNIDNKISLKIGDKILANNNYGVLNMHELYDVIDENVDLYLRPIIRESIAQSIKWDFKNGKYTK